MVVKDAAAFAAAVGFRVVRWGRGGWVAEVGCGCGGGGGAEGGGRGRGGEGDVVALEGEVS